MSAYPLPDGRAIIGALSTKFGRQTRDGRWIEQPAAKYECLVCETTEVVRGADKVQRFTQTIRITHPATCPGDPTQQGARAA
ncbi:hypothetical protein [Streptomyces sp. or3]|uniref:hypothetical protein n=1 Tax=Streptomyces sp. or3 TaxID=1828020 RepID=UPI000BFBD2EA|nr:hypothetical protein [Streptomyces sp. or3]